MSRNSTAVLPRDGHAQAEPSITSSALVLRLIRREVVLQATGLSRSAMYRLMSSGQFPRPVSITRTSVAWLLSEVEAWIASKIADRNAAGGRGGDK